MARARPVAIGDRQVDPEGYTDLRARRLAAREFNVGFSGEMQRDNRIQAGRWWTPDEPPPWAQFSVEEAGLGEAWASVWRYPHLRWLDRLCAPVTSLRSVAWDSFNVNFRRRTAADGEGPAGHLPDQPLSRPGQRGLTVEMVKRFPAVSVIDVRRSLPRCGDHGARRPGGRDGLRVHADRGGAGQRCGEVSRDERALARWRSCAPWGLAAALLGGLLAEFGLCWVGRRTAGSGIGERQWLSSSPSELFELPGRVSPNVWWLGIGGGTVVVGLVGWLATRRLAGVPPLARCLTQTNSHAGCGPWMPNTPVPGMAPFTPACAGERAGQVEVIVECFARRLMAPFQAFCRSSAAGEAAEHRRRQLGAVCAHLTSFRPPGLSEVRFGTWTGDFGLRRAMVRGTAAGA